MKITIAAQLDSVRRLVRQVEDVVDEWYVDDSGVHPANKNQLSTVREILRSMESGLEGISDFESVESSGMARLAGMR
jgi:hypothetical protein